MQCSYTYPNDDSCQRNALPNDPDGFCIGHSHWEKKDAGAFQVEAVGQVTRLKNERDICDCRGWSFLPHCNFLKGKVIIGKADFSDCVFQDVDFGATEFKLGVNFDNTALNGLCSFQGATIEIEGTFNGTKFGDQADFTKGRLRNTRFENVNFDGDSHFGGDVDTLRIWNCTFKKDFTLEGDRLNGLDFRGLQCFGYVGFSSDAKANGLQIKEQCEFNNDVQFSNTYFQGKVEVEESRFTKETYFDNCNFDGEVSFSNVEFGPTVDFSNATFSQDVNFFNCKFQTSYFAGTKFRKRVSFISCEFNDETIFEDAVWEGEVYFLSNTSPGKFSMKDSKVSGVTFTIHKSKFKMDCDFSGMNLGIGSSPNFSCRECEFFEKMNFERGIFNGIMSFEDVTLHKYATFETGQFNKEVLFNCISILDECSFAGVNLANVTFRKTNLTNCSFLHARGLHEVYLDGVDWNCENGRREGQLLDEYSLRGNKNLSGKEFQTQCAIIKQLYIDLKRNYEDKRDFQSAGNFHFGEREVERLSIMNKSKLKGNLFSLDALYYWFSGYGENSTRSMAWLTFVVLFLSFVYYLSLGVGNEGVSNATNFLDYIAFTITVPPLKAWKGYEPLTDFVRWIRLANSFIIPILVALMVLAIRRKFRRN